MPVYQMLQHVFNHATYHRGQLVTMLRQLGQDKIPDTDFYTYCRLKGIRIWDLGNLDFSSSSQNKSRQKQI